MLRVFRKFRDPLIVGALVVLPLINFLTTGHRGRQPNFIDRTIVFVASPIQSVCSWLITQTRSVVEGYISLRGAHTDADQCRVAESELRAEVNSLREVRAENERLKKLLSVAEDTTAQRIHARVIGINPTNQFQSIRLSRGEADGLRVGMPVATDLGVIGHLIRVTGGAADVMLLTDPASRIGVVNQRTRARGTAVGSGNGTDLTLSYVRNDELVVDGDTFVTAGTDGIFPRGLMVGTVQSVAHPTVGMFLSAKLTPGVQLDRVEDVMVLPVELSTPVADVKDTKR